MINYIKLSLLCFSCIIFTNGFGQTILNPKKIERLVANVVEKAMQTSVYMIEWDTLKNQVKEGVDKANGFTGVVVSKQGHILTVSHAAVPNQVYMISFPDGSRHIGVGLGRIGLQNKGKDYDMAVVKISTQGNWPFAEMAPSSQMKIDQPVISISYPGAFFKLLPNVRYGRISDCDVSDGFIVSSAKMEPGDSGGPLFDEHGRVVGIHSWIGENEDENYDVPIDNFLKYWTALNISKDYHELPPEDTLPTEIAPVKISQLVDLKSLAGLSIQNSKSVINLTSIRGTQEISILGTLIEYENTSYILSKSSMVFSRPKLKIGSRFLPVDVVNRDEDKDLVLLVVAEQLQTGIKIRPDDKNPDLSVKDLGKILITALPKDSISVGILSATYTSMPLVSSYGYIGAVAQYSNGKITLSRIGRSGAPYLKLNDQVIKINSVEILTANDYNREFTKYLAGDSISLDIIRDRNPMQIHLYLQGQPTERHVSFNYPGGRSARSDKFKNVLVHDAAIKADECGSPVFNMSGEFYGINIARRSRSASIIMPIAAIAEFVNDNQNIKK